MTHPAKSIRPTRIVPALPLSYSRLPRNKKTDEPKQPPRAVTPDRNKKPLTDSPSKNETQHDSSASQSTSSFQEPMTPDSVASAVAKVPMNGDTVGIDVGLDVGALEHEGAWNTHGEIYFNSMLVPVLS